MKRILSLLSAAALALAFFLPAASASAEFDPASITSPHVLVMDADSGSVLYEKGARDKAYPASTTKIMTCILALEESKMDDQVTVGTAVKTGSVLGMADGETMSMKDMLYGLMLKSGNDCAKAIAEHISGSVDAFVEKMNAKATELGMTGTHFVTPNGLHDENHYSTAYDMALLTRFAMQNEDFRTIVATASYHIEGTNKNSAGYDLTNSNKLIYAKDAEASLVYENATGVKTGDTTQAGRCLVATATKNGTSLIVVIMGDMESKVSTNYRFENAKKLFEWAFAKFVTVDANTLNLKTSFEENVANASFSDEKKGVLELTADLSGKKVAGTSDFIESIKSSSDGVTADYKLTAPLTAPIKAGDVVGTVNYQFSGQTILTANLIASRDVAGISSTASPSATGPLIDNVTGSNESSPWLFLILVAVVIVGAVVGVRVYLLDKKKRRGVRRRRKSAYRVYKRR